MKETNQNKIEEHIYVALMNLAQKESDKEITETPIGTIRKKPNGNRIVTMNASVFLDEDNEGNYGIVMDAIHSCSRRPFIIKEDDDELDVYPFISYEINRGKGTISLLISNIVWKHFVENDDFYKEFEAIKKMAELI